MLPIRLGRKFASESTPGLLASSFIALLCKTIVLIEDSASLNAVQFNSIKFMKPEIKPQNLPDTYIVP